VLCYVNPEVLHELLLHHSSFARLDIRIASPTTRQRHASTLISASISPASSSPSTLRHVHMDIILGTPAAPPSSPLLSACGSSPTHHRLHKLRPSLPHLAHTRSDQPMCMTHPAPVASVLIMRVSSLSMEGCCCVLSSGSSGATRGLLRCCMLTTHCLLCTTQRR